MATTSTRGLLVTLEGPEGSGKSTQTALLHEWLVDKGYTVLRTREPGGTRIGERIRAVLHDPAYAEMAAEAEILLYSAARAQLVAEVIRPALEAGQLVLCDRFFDSTYAYQGYGRGLALDVLRGITRFATGGLTPDLTLYLDIDPAMGLQRRMQGNGEINRLDRETLVFHQKVRQGYLELARQEPSRWIHLDASGDISVVQSMLRERLNARLANWTGYRRSS